MNVHTISWAGGPEFGLDEAIVRILLLQNLGVAFALVVAVYKIGRVVLELLAAARIRRERVRVEVSI